MFALWLKRQPGYDVVFNCFLSADFETVRSDTAEHVFKTVKAENVYQENGCMHAQQSALELHFLINNEQKECRTKFFNLKKRICASVK